MSEFPERIVSYLLDCSLNYLPDSCIKLKSYFNIHASEIAEKCNLSLPKFITNKNIACPFCFTEWKSNTTSFKLRPSTGKRFSDPDKSEHKKQGEKSQHTRNQLVLKCKICLRRTVFSLKKPENVNKDTDSFPVEILQKKKRKKKKKFASLSVKACLQAGNKLHRKKKKEKTKNSSSAASNQKLKEIKSKETVTLFRNPFALGYQSINSESNKTAQNSSKTNNKMKNSSQKKLEISNMRKKQKQMNALKKVIKEEKCTPMKASIKNLLKVI